jgi:acetyl-CoA carboxylase carboxyltransferase component
VDVAQRAHRRDGRRTGRRRAGQVKREQAERSGRFSAEEEAEIKQPILDQYEHQGHPYYSSARLWDDGVIDPAQTRDVLAWPVRLAERADRTEPLRRVPDVTHERFQPSN